MGDTGYITYNGISISCGQCKGDFHKIDHQWTILWSNQHGTKLRIFCPCGWWTDWRILYRDGVAQITRLWQPTHG